MHPGDTNTTPLEPQAGPGGLHRARAAFGEAGGPLHRLDYADFALGPQGMGLVRRAALEVLRRFGAVDEARLALLRALALFLDHVFWAETTGGCILHADFPGASFRLPIARSLFTAAARSCRRRQKC